MPAIPTTPATGRSGFRCAGKSAVRQAAGRTFRASQSLSSRSFTFGAPAATVAVRSLVAGDPYLVGNKSWVVEPPPCCIFFMSSGFIVLVADELVLMAVTLCLP